VYVHNVRIQKIHAPMLISRCTYMVMRLFPYD